jgi:YfiH family protein
MPHTIKQAPTTGPITIPAFEAGSGVRHFFGTRSHPTDLRFPFDEHMSTRTVASDVPYAIVSVKQVHGRDALIVDKPVEAGMTFDGEWDAVITNQPGVLVTVRTADCVPVLVHDPIHNVVAAIHSGWRGSVAGIVPRTLVMMQQTFESAAESMYVAIGPSAGLCCYEVDEPVLEPIRAFSFWPSVVRETGQGRALLDLRAFICSQAQAAGIRDENMWTVDLCTICQPNVFHSYRREGIAKQTMSSGIMLSARRVVRSENHRDAS